MAELSALHPAAQVAAVVMTGVVVAIFAWHLGRSLREM